MGCHGGIFGFVFIFICCSVYKSGEPPFLYARKVLAIDGRGVKTGEWKARALSLRTTAACPAHSSSASRPEQGFLADSCQTLNGAPHDPIKGAVCPPPTPVLFLPPLEGTWPLVPHVGAAAPEPGNALTTPTPVLLGADIQEKCIKNSLRRHILLRAVNEKCIHREHAPLL